MTIHTALCLAVVFAELRRQGNSDELHSLVLRWHGVKSICYYLFSGSLLSCISVVETQHVCMSICTTFLQYPQIVDLWNPQATCSSDSTSQVDAKNACCHQQHTLAACLTAHFLTRVLDIAQTRLQITHKYIIPCVPKFRNRQSVWICVMTLHQGSHTAN